MQGVHLHVARRSTSDGRLVLALALDTPVARRCPKLLDFTLRWPTVSSRKGIQIGPFQQCERQYLARTFTEIIVNTSFVRVASRLDVRQYETKLPGLSGLKLAVFVWVSGRRRACTWGSYTYNSRHRRMTRLLAYDPLHPLTSCSAPRASLLQSPSTPFDDRHAVFPLLGLARSSRGPRNRFLILRSG